MVLTRWRFIFHQRLERNSFSIYTTTTIILILIQHNALVQQQFESIYFELMASRIDPSYWLCIEWRRVQNNIGLRLNVGLNYTLKDSKYYQISIWQNSQWTYNFSTCNNHLFSLTDFSPTSQVGYVNMKMTFEMPQTIDSNIP